MSDFTKEMVVKAVNKGASYLLSSRNEDGGVKYENERSDISGVWVTAEALESLLSSKVLALPSFEKMKPMIDFLLSAQRDDGSWPILNKNKRDEPSSSISTGHCVYALKLSMIGGYFSSPKIKEAIDKGEEWLRSQACCIEKNGYIFWTSEPIDANMQSSVDPNISIKSRMEYIFASFYAVMGFANPSGYGYKVAFDPDAGLIKKARIFFQEQAEYFIGQYSQESDSTSDVLSLAKAASTICRLINFLI